MMNLQIDPYWDAKHGLDLAIPFQVKRKYKKKMRTLNKFLESFPKVISEIIASYSIQTLEIAKWKCCDFSILPCYWNEAKNDRELSVSTCEFGELSIDSLLVWRGQILAVTYQNSTWHELFATSFCEWGTRGLQQFQKKNYSN